MSFPLAASFAAQAHTTQRRDDAAGTPYINHPLEVVEILVRCGMSHDVLLSAAVLHDTIEDTATTYDDLVRFFGIVIATLVMEVTDDKTLPKAERKRLQVEHAKSASAFAKAIKMADKISNLTSIQRELPRGWDRERAEAYFAWAKQVTDNCTGVCSALEARLASIYAEGVPIPYIDVPTHDLESRLGCKDL